MNTIFEVIEDFNAQFDRRDRADGYASYMKNALHIYLTAAEEHANSAKRKQGPEEYSLQPKRPKADSFVSGYSSFENGSSDLGGYNTSLTSFETDASGGVVNSQMSKMLAQPSTENAELLKIIETQNQENERLRDTVREINL